MQPRPEPTDIGTSSDMQNIGDLFREQKTATKYASSMEKLKAQIDEGKVVLKGILITDSLDVAKMKATTFINLMYDEPSAQLRYLSKKADTEDVVKQAYHIILQKMDSLSKIEDQWKKELNPD